MPQSYADAMRQKTKGSEGTTAPKNATIPAPPVKLPAKKQSKKEPPKTVWGTPVILQRPTQPKSSSSLNPEAKGWSFTENASPSDSPPVRIPTNPQERGSNVPAVRGAPTPHEPRHRDRGDAKQPHPTQNLRKQAPILLKKPIGDKTKARDKTKSPKDKVVANKGGSSVSLPSAATRLQVNSASDFPALSSSSSKPNKVIPNPQLRWGVTTKKSTQNPKQVDHRSEKTTMTTEHKAKQPQEKKKKTTKRKEDPERVSQSGASSFFAPKESRTDDDAHQLLRLMQDRTIYKKKGRQRVAPRKKTFTALKKKVLQERLNKWRALHPEEGSTPQRSADTLPALLTGGKDSVSVCLYNYVHKDDTTDDDEYDEIIENLRAMALRVGPIVEHFIPRDLHREDKYPAFIRFQSREDANAAVGCWNELVIGGEMLEAFSLVEDNSMTVPWADMVLQQESILIHSAEQSRKTEAASVATISGILTVDDYEDEDCMNETLGDLRQMAEKHGPVVSVTPTSTTRGDVFISFAVDEATMTNIVEKLSRETMAGEKVHASVERGPNLTGGSTDRSIVLTNVLSVDDLSDSECLQETLEDVRELAEKYGKVVGVSSAKETVIVTYEEQSFAVHAMNALNGMQLGGSAICAVMHGAHQTDTLHQGIDVLLTNLLTDDDLEDEDCLQESLVDIRILAEKCGELSRIGAEKTESGVVVKATFSDNLGARNAVVEFEGKVIGGHIVTASIRGEDASEEDGKRKKTSQKVQASKKARTDDKKPLYSGDKLIPERFAACKRVPKTPNSTEGPREYARATNDDQVKPLLSEMLGELMRLQKRAMVEKNTKARRRIVMGLREVARGIRSHKVKMVVMANNLDEYGAIDEKLQEIIDLAHQEDVPLFFEFTKRSLGKALGKSIKIAVVGIQNAEGAHQPFKKLSSIAMKMA